MVSISLLPKEFRQLDALRKKQAHLLILFGTVSLSLLLIMGIVSINGRTARHQLDNTLAYKQLLEQQLHSLAPFEEPYERLVTLNEIMKQIESEQVGWIRLLHQIGVQTPQGVWLTDFHGSPSDSGKVIEIVLKGRALDHLQVAQFLKQLENTPSLSDVKCLYSTGQPDQTQFEITATAKAGSLTSENL